MCSTPASSNRRSGGRRNWIEICGVAPCEALPGAEIEGDARPAPVLDQDLQRGERLGLGSGGDARLVAVGGDLPSVEQAGTVLPADAVAQHLFRLHRADRVEHLHLLVTDRLGRERRGRLHRDEREELEDVVLHDVPHDAGVLVVRAAPLDPELLGDRDLHVVDVAPVPDRLEHPVREPEHHQVLDRLLPEVVIDPVDLALVEHAGELAVQRSGRVEVVTEGLLDDDAPPARVLAGEPGGAEPAHDGAELGWRRREVEERVAGRAVLLRRVRERRRDRLVRRRVLEVALDVVDAGGEVAARARRPRGASRARPPPRPRTRGRRRRRARGGRRRRTRSRGAGARSPAGCRGRAGACAS